MSDTEFVGNNTAYTNDDLHNANANADELINFENTKADLNNCLHEALTEKLKPCRYYQPGQKLPVAQKEIKLFMLHVNIRSLQKNLNNLNHELLQTLSNSPDILLLSETKIKLSPLTNVNLTGYQPVMLANSQTNAGGVGVYVTDKLTVTLLGKNELNSTCQDIWLRISNKTGNDSFIVGVIYRHPRGDVNNFLTALNKKLDLLSNKRYYLFGDFNINVNSTVNNEDGLNYLNTISSNEAYSLINKPTRVTNVSQTTIDHIVTNDSTHVIYPVIFLSDLTDHYPIACCVTGDPNRTNLKIKQDNHYCYRDTGQFNCDWFKMDLQEALEVFFNAKELTSSDQIDFYFENFVSTFRTCLNKYALLKRASRKKRKLMSKP